MATRSPSPFDRTTSGAGSTADQANDVLGHVADQAQQTAGQVVDQAKQQATSKLGDQKEQAVGSVGSLAQALRQSGQQLRDKDEAPLAGAAENAAERLEGVAAYLRQNTIEDIIADAEDFARRQPAIFLGGAFFLGLLASRFLRSSGSAGTGDGAGSTALARRAPSPSLSGFPSRPTTLPPDAFHVPAVSGAMPTTTTGSTGFSSAASPQGSTGAGAGSSGMTNASGSGRPGSAGPARSGPSGAPDNASPSSGMGGPATQRKP